MNRTDLQRWWDTAWRDGLWAVGWEKALDGLSPQDAAWRPAAGRHSIWQIVAHMIFWREDGLRRMAGGGPPDAETLRKLNFPEPAEISAAAWEQTRARLSATQQRMHEALGDERQGIERIEYVLPHDMYHVGQIMYLRSMLGKPPID